MQANLLNKNCANKKQALIDKRLFFIERHGLSAIIPSTSQAWD
jgi:hypothetical protein